MGARLAETDEKGVARCETVDWLLIIIVGLMENEWNELSIAHSATLPQNDTIWIIQLVFNIQEGITNV